jgi:hypothetical protein
MEQITNSLVTKIITLTIKIKVLLKKKHHITHRTEIKKKKKEEEEEEDKQLHLRVYLATQGYQL